MRPLAGVLALTLFAPLASAAPPAEPAPASPAAPAPPTSAPRVARARVPLRVVRVMPESHQALLFDRSRSTHVLAEVGGTIDGYTVEDIDDDQVTLRFQGTEVVLAAPAAAPVARRPRTARGSTPPRVAAADSHADVAVPPAGPASVAAAPADQAPVDPYNAAAIRVGPAPPADRGTGASAEAAARVAEPTASGEPTPPADAGEARRRVAPAGEAAASAPPAVAIADPGPPRAPTPAAVAAAPAAAWSTASAAAPPAPPAAGPPAAEPPVAAEPPAAPVAAEPPAPSRGDGVTLSRAEVERALADFAKLTLAMHGSFTASGVRVDGVGDGTIFQRVGLRAGDVIASVDGAPLRTLDDAATLYARAGSAKAFTAQVVRHGAPVALHVTIQ